MSVPTQEQLLIEEQLRKKILAEEDVEKLNGLIAEIHKAKITPTQMYSLLTQVENQIAPNPVFEG